MTLLMYKTIPVHFAKDSGTFCWMSSDRALNTVTHTSTRVHSEKTSGLDRVI